MKASLIISIYNNITFLKVILDSLHFQTEKNFEIIIAEDGENTAVKNFINQYPFEQPYQHLTQIDEGWRKNKAMNAAIRSVKTDWLIFIDGDCVLHPKFIEMHLRFANENTILAGKRVMISAESSLNLIEQRINISQIQSHLLKKVFFSKEKIRHLEESFFISPESLFRLISKIRKQHGLLGCNMSFSKKAIYKINGFDEDYKLPAVGEDADLTWRFDKIGLHVKSIRNLAIVYHLYHDRKWGSPVQNLEIYRKKRFEEIFVCKNGLLKNN
jgi:cellulose synthase/poly-beta-1,6-N-acetylglucosamine synthase-like glycosyltransferase